MGGCDEIELECNSAADESGATEKCGQTHKDCSIRMADYLKENCSLRPSNQH